MYRLFASKGCGSAAIEAALTLCGVNYELVEATPWERSPGLDELRRLNPLAQVPTLQLPDGTVLTESVAILLWLAEQYPAAALLPDNPSLRASTLRWLVYVAVNNYAAIGIGDFPERWTTGEAEQATLKAYARSRLEDYWRTLEQQFANERLPLAPTGALALLLYTMRHWRPGKDWLDQHCPRLMAGLQPTADVPQLAAIWTRNFKT
ncbi:glutathione S-transferase [Chitinimonas sp.]|uniref:glutathione S-transferase family protein n=1 Tax=Chitinimonas sp. TaxID=1934313 RepID=UPI002F920C66